MQTVDWLWLLHPVLAVVVIYPLLGQVLRLALQTRRRRLEHSKDPASVGRDHADLGRLLSGAVVLGVLVALVVVIGTSKPLAEFAGGPSRLGLLSLVVVGTAAAFTALWRARNAAYRASFALLTWAGLIGLGLQGEVYRLSDNPFQLAFWQSHFWGGIGLCGLLLLSLASKPEIHRSLRWRRLHVSANVLAAVVFLAQGISGPRDLLEIPLSWQKPAVYGCNFETQQCPAPQPPQS